jgi:hypothetical protein
MLNLDDISEEADIPMTEDDATECVLCMYTNHAYLDHMHHTLSSTTSKTNMYSILYDAFNKQMAELKKQGMEHHTITKDALVRHYEYHVISFERAVMEDVRLLKQLMETLQKKILTHDGLDSKALNQWKALSTHKLKLLSKIKHQKQPMNVKIEPYDFSK